MARGFWTGLLHGAGISAIGLVALSLLTPLPQQGTAPLPATDAGNGNAGETAESASPGGETTPGPGMEAADPGSLSQAPRRMR
ncbi:hypothetical protein [Paracoccus methylarcula]|uniref:Uncharacterized protein n=1 Tax=Paracoccus methylarcula TaxID=72022 RepID=A0A422QTW1_9RHOB|nr:hypothetical protein [Paracoccus methylarcula]RNF33414.1 hypothetical protein A7A09_016845 [Paracoccus methylarcula]